MFEKWQNQEKPKNFHCPICGSTKYEVVEKRNILDPIDPKRPKFVECYICKGCSIVFKSVEKFSKAAKNSFEGRPLACFFVLIFLDKYVMIVI